MGTAAIYLGLALALVAVNGFFVAAEFALVRVRRSRIDALVAEGNKGAARVQWHLERLDQVLSVAQLGITMASLAIGWIGEPGMAALLEPVFDAFGMKSETLRHSVAFGVGFSVLSALHIVVGEQVPKMLAIANAERASMAVARPMRFFGLVLYPAMVVLKWSTDLLLKILGVQAGEHEGAPSSEELRQIVASSHAHGHLSEEERDILRNAFDFTERTVREVAVPRTDIAWIDVNDDFETGIGIMTSRSFSRYPLAEEGLDKVIGVVHTRDIFLRARTGQPVKDFRQVRRDALFLPESNTLTEALREFQRQRQSIALVFDEFGVVSGLLSLEDVVEEIVGNIEDEFDEPNPDIVDRGDGSYLVAGDVPLHDLDEVLDSGLAELPEGEYVSVGGLVLDELGRAPRAYDEVLVAGFRIRVLEVEGLRILRLLVQRVEAAPPEARQP